MRAKTFKSEYHLGGTCKVSFPYYPNVGETVVKINFGGYRERVFRLWSRSRMQEFLEDNTSSYHAEKIMDYIKAAIWIRDVTAPHR